MEDFQEARRKAIKNLNVADHMISMSYPLLRDNKLLLASLENLFLSLTNAMASILYYERLFKRVPPFPENFESKFSLFKKYCVPRYNIDNEHVRLIAEIKELILEHHKSPIEFSRGNKFVICTDDYRIKSISPETIKGYVSKAKIFIDYIIHIVSKDEGLFGGGGGGTETGRPSDICKFKVHPHS